VSYAKAFIMSTLGRERAGEAEVTRVNQIVDSDPPEVGYLLIIRTLADRSTGKKSRLTPIP
jgi:hypothetical protein